MPKIEITYLAKATRYSQCEVHGTKLKLGKTFLTRLGRWGSTVGMSVIVEELRESRVASDYQQRAVTDATFQIGRPIQSQSQTE